MFRQLLVAGLLAALPARGDEAQDATPVNEVRLAPGRELRAYTADQQLQGTLLEAEPGVLRLQDADGSVREVSLADLRLLEARGGGVAGGALWGGATVGWLGGSLTTAVCMLANALGESGSPNAIHGCALVGAALGTGIGTLVGALIGSATSTWPAVYAPDVRGPTPLQLRYDVHESAPVVDRSRVELGLGLALLVDPDEVGVPLAGARTRLHLLVPVGERLALGLEASFGQLDHFFEPQGSFAPERDDDVTQTFSDVGLRARYFLGPAGGALRPLLSAALGLQGLSMDTQEADSTQSSEALGLAAAVGGGLDWVPVPGAPGLTLEALWRQGLGTEGPRVSHLELGLTGALRF